MEGGTSKSPVPMDSDGTSPGAFDKVITAVRARPLNSNDGPRATSIIRYFGKETKGLGIVDPTNQDVGAERMFQFDHTFWSVDRANTEFYAGQADVFEAVGLPILETCLKGVNCSLFAYGQTGSGKTYTMMGSHASSEEAGVIPRLCRSLLQKLEQSMASSPPEAGGAGVILMKADVSIAYVEIYNEKVFDLLSQTPGTACRVREHPESGAYVENLTKAPVIVYDDVDKVLREGGGKRHVAATLMNSESSRSHAVFTLFITQYVSLAGQNPTEQIIRKSKVSLVDLAGSERMSTTGASGDRLREASNINRSLSVLGDVIKALSEKNRLKNSTKNHDFVPYRNSVLTWLLKDSLGGNSRTTMLATISPTDSSYNESINTLRYIERTKLIVNAVSANISRNENVRINDLLKQISDLELKYAELQGHQLDREQHHRDDIEKMQAEFEAQFTEQLKVLAAELERHYAQQSRLNSQACNLKKGLSFAEAVFLESEAEQESSSTCFPPETVPFKVDNGGVFEDKNEIIQKFTDVIREKDEIIRNYEKVLSTSKVDEDSTIISLKDMVATLKDQVRSANVRYDTICERYREFSDVVEVERNDAAQMYTNMQVMAAEITKLKLDSAKKDRELQDRSKENDSIRIDLDRLRESYHEIQNEHKKLMEILEACLQDLAELKSQNSDLESLLDIERYGNALKSAMVQDLHVQLTQEHASSEAKLNQLSQSIDLHNVKIEELKRDYDDRILDLERIITDSRQEILVQQTVNHNNMINLQEVLETARSDQEEALFAKNAEILLLSEKLSATSQELVLSREQFASMRLKSAAQWRPIVLCFQTLCEKAKDLKKCLKTNNIDDIIPFLEETRRCYKGSDVSIEEHKEEIIEHLSSVYSTFRDIAMAWMKHTVGADKDYDYKDLAEALVLAKVEIAQNHYELENLQYLLKSGEKDKTRGIAAVWGSIGARGRSFLFENNGSVEDAASFNDALTIDAPSVVSELDSIIEEANDAEGRRNDKNSCTENPSKVWRLWRSRK